MKYFLILIMFISGSIWAQKKVKLITDTSFHAPCWCEMTKYVEDTTQWYLYKIADNQYFYFAWIPYGYRDKYGWDDAVYRAEKVYKKETYLLASSKITDTIPEIINYGEYNDSCKCLKEWQEWSVGGLMGEVIKIGNAKFSKK